MIVFSEINVVKIRTPLNFSKSKKAGRGGAAAPGAAGAADPGAGHGRRDHVHDQRAQPPHPVPLGRRNLLLHPRESQMF